MRAGIVSGADRWGQGYGPSFLAQGFLTQGPKLTHFRPVDLLKLPPPPYTNVASAPRFTRVVPGLYLRSKVGVSRLCLNTYLSQIAIKSLLNQGMAPQKCAHFRKEGSTSPKEILMESVI